jgi:hypothetical protein
VRVVCEDAGDGASEGPNGEELEGDDVVACTRNPSWSNSASELRVMSKRDASSNGAKRRFLVDEEAVVPACDELLEYEQPRNSLERWAAAAVMP